MRVTFVNPPYEHTSGPFRKLAHFTAPPLSLGYLAAYLRKELPEVEVDNLEAATLCLNQHEILEWIGREKPDIIAFTTVTLTANTVKKIARAVKENLPQTLIIAGGVHPTVLPFDLFPEVDICVLGEGENTLAEIVRARLSGEDYSAIEGIAFHRDGENVRNRERPLIENLDSLPFPARDLLPLDRYVCQYPHRAPTRRYTNMLSSRGCPYDCNFCASRQIWRRRVRFRSPDNILEEIREVVEGQGISMIHFDDDTFCLNRERSVELFHKMIESGLNFRWSCMTRVDTVDEELLRLMKDAGCVDVQMGIESGDPEVLRKIGKEITLEEIRKAFRLLKNSGIPCYKGHFILGHVGETPESARRTIELALELDPPIAFISVMVPFPGSRAYDHYKAKNCLLTDNWDAYNYFADPVTRTDEMPPELLKKLYREANIRFFLRPGKVMKYLLDTLRSGRYDILSRSFWNIMNKIFS